MMSMPLWLLIVAASIPLAGLLMTVINLHYYRRSDPSAIPAGRAGGESSPPRVFVCIPARNEEANLEACARSILANDYAPSDRSAITVLVYDDQSTDRTAAILSRLISDDSRVRRVPTRSLPPGWIGKQWACYTLGQAALVDAEEQDRLLFIDCDVRLNRDCLRRSIATAQALKADLLSTFPRQITGSIGEALLVPLIHFLLLSYLPFGRMRTNGDPNASAACGQFIMVTARAYRTTGGHSTVKDSMHEGVKLPRVIRKAGLRSDLFDGTDLCSCRMYAGLVQTWRGFAKNAYEGLGSLGLLVFITLMHIVGHVLPWVCIGWWTLLESGPSRAHEIAAFAAVMLAIGQRLLLAAVFNQSNLGVLLHPIGVTMMTLVQWHSYVIHVLGLRAWRGRAASMSSASGAA